MNLLVLFVLACASIGSTLAALRGSHESPRRGNSGGASLVPESGRAVGHLSLMHDNTWGHEEDAKNGADQGKIVGARRRRAGEESSESDEGAVPVSAPTTIVGKDGHGTAPPWTSASKKETEPPPAKEGKQSRSGDRRHDLW